KIFLGEAEEFFLVNFPSFFVIAHSLAFRPQFRQAPGRPNCAWSSLAFPISNVESLSRLLQRIAKPCLGCVCRQTIITSNLFPRESLHPPQSHFASERVAPRQALVQQHLVLELLRSMSPRRIWCAADFAETDELRLFALDAIDLPQKALEQIRPHVANGHSVDRRILRPYARDHCRDFLQRSCDHRRIAEQFQAMFKRLRKNFFSRRKHRWLDISAAPVNSVEADQTARTFSRHCGYNRGSAKRPEASDVYGYSDEWRLAAAT